MKVSVPPAIELLTRKKAIFNICAEFSQLILGSSSLEATLRKGIIEKQILEWISFRIVVLPSGNICAEVSISIDWDAHRIALGSEGDMIMIESGSSVSEQILESAPVIASLIEGYKSEFPGSIIKTAFNYCKSVRSNPAQLSEARSFLGHTASKAEDNKWLKPEGKYRYAEVTIQPKLLTELSVSVRGITRKG